MLTITDLSTIQHRNIVFAISVIIVAEEEHIDEMNEKAWCYLGSCGIISTPLVQDEYD